MNSNEFIELADQLFERQRIEITVWESDHTDTEYVYQNQIKYFKSSVHTFTVGFPPEPMLSSIRSCIEPGVQVGAVVQRQLDGAKIIFYPEVKAVHWDGSGIELIMPESGELIQIRKHYRVNVELPVHIQMKPADMEPMTIKGVSINMSAGGMKLLAPPEIELLELPEGMEIQSDQLIHITFMADEEYYTLPAKVLGCVVTKEMDLTATLKRRWSHGLQSYVLRVQFMDLTPNAEAKLVAYCHQLQLSSKLLEP